MDSVRLGRVLGIGARGAAKALVGAVDAATAPNPRASAPAARPSASESPRVEVPQRAPDVVAAAARGAARVTVKTTRQVKETQRGVVRGGKRFGEAVWGPFVKLSGVLWLEITGSFFGIFALFAGQAVWTHRADLLSSADRDAHLRAMVFVGVALLFGYFCVTSFIKARRRERSR